MDKTAIKNFSVWARNALIRSVTDRCGLVGVRADGIQNPLPQSTKDIQFFDAGTGAPSSISGKEIAQRDALVMKIREKERDTDYKTAYNYVIEQVAYTWFNRLIAIRFMEVNDYLPSRIRVLSSEQDGKLEPDIVTNPFDADFDFSEQERDTIIQLKDRGQMEDMDALFRILFTKQCDALHELLPGLFQKIDDRDYTQLLLNLSFTDREGVVYHLVNDIDEANFDINREGQVEIIGWMYQYYNTEPKDETFALLKKNVKITKEHIPAATQLFTPDWIVRYMVENSLGRLWVEGHPNDDLKANWKYYLEEAEQEASVQAQLDEIRKEYQTLNLEEIKLIDPCMGSGHILVYAFDVFMDIYRSQGWIERDAAQSIVQNNLYGLDIDDRAYQLAYFAIMMKARQYDRRFLTRGITPNVYSIQESNHVRRSQLKYFGEELSELERNNANAQIDALLDTLIDAKEYGSILDVDNCDWDLLSRFAGSIGVEEQFSFETDGIDETQKKLQSLIAVAKVMAQKYEVVTTNPPYMGAGNMGAKLSLFIKDNFPDSKSDLFAVFIDKSKKFATKHGFIALITMHGWMFLQSFEKLRTKIAINREIVNMAHLGMYGFGAGDVGTIVQTTAFVLSKSHRGKAAFARLVSGENTETKAQMLRDIALKKSVEHLYFKDTKTLSGIPGIPVAYWISDNSMQAFDAPPFDDRFVSGGRNKTHNNNLYVRNWWEVRHLDPRWKLYSNGGAFFKWYGSNYDVVDWSESARSFYAAHGGLVKKEYWDAPAITWNDITIGTSCFRIKPVSAVYSSASPTIFSYDKQYDYNMLSFLNSKVCEWMLGISNSTLHTLVGNVLSLPDKIQKCNKSEDARRCVALSKEDWDSFECSYDFQIHPLVAMANKQLNNTGETLTVESAFQMWKLLCEERFAQITELEEGINRSFIDAYGLSDELSPKVDSNSITIRQADLQRDIRSLVSYSVGCMFGRYSLDETGIVFAGGKWDIAKYKTFVPDPDNCILITETDYYKDDIVGRFCEWMSVVFGVASLEENLKFVADGLGTKGTTPREKIRNYFLSDFFKDHCSSYSVAGSGKRHIYWLYDSGKQNGFKALVYMHRYNEDTTGKIRAEYLFKMQRAYENELKRVQDTIDGSNNSREVAQAEKRKEKLTKQLKETRDYDQKIAHLALARIGIDLDDGVKVNYEKVQTAPDGKKLEILAPIK